MRTEKEMAKFTKTAEFARLKEHLESRIEFYSQYLPDGRPVTEVSNEERGHYWLIASIINGEFKSVIASYMNAAESVKNAK